MKKIPIHQISGFPMEAIVDTFASGSAFTVSHKGHDIKGHDHHGEEKGDFTLRFEW